MCLKEFGVELPLMLRSHPHVHAYLYLYGARVLHLTLRLAHLPVAAFLCAEMKALLDLDRRGRGERRPKRLHQGRFLRDPYHFFCAKLPYGGLHLPQGELHGAIEVELYVEARQPLYHHDVIYHLKGSDPRHHPFGDRLQWVAHRQWSTAQQYVRVEHQREESPCGCCVRVRSSFLPLVEVGEPPGGDEHPEGSCP